MVLALLVAVVAVVLVSGGSDSKDSASTATTGSPAATVTTRAGETTPTTKGNDAPTTTAGRPGGPCKAADVDMGMSGATIRDVNAVTVVSVTNTGGRTCTINGFPGVQLLGPDDAKVPTTVTQGGGGVPAGLTAATITLDNGAKASFVMAWDQVNGTCADVRSFDITLPGDSKADNVKSSVTVCGNGTVNVGPFQAGTVSP